MKTHTGATLTVEGYIPHIEVFTDAGIIHAPVKVTGEMRRDRNEKIPMPVPLRRDGRLVYALPGGGEIRA